MGPELIMNGRFLPYHPDGRSDPAAGINSEWYIADGTSLLGFGQASGIKVRMVHRRWCILASYLPSGFQQGTLYMVKPFWRNGSVWEHG